MASKPVVIAATAKHTATIIFLHGLGDTGLGWAGTIASIKPAHVKVVCPTAPTMPVTLNGGMRMPSWFDLRSLDISGPEDEQGIKAAADSVHQLIQQEISSGIPSNRIILGGFSQGGGLAIYSALRFAQPLAGVVALSCWLPMHKHFPAQALGNMDIPYLQCHGDCDPVVSYRWGQATANILKQFVANSEFRTYQGLMHNSDEQELKDMKGFIEKLLPAV